MGLISMIEDSFARLVPRKRGESKSAFHPIVEALEHRLLFDAQVNSLSHDAPGAPAVNTGSSNYVSHRKQVPSPSTRRGAMV